MLVKGGPAVLIACWVRPFVYDTGYIKGPLIIWLRVGDKMQSPRYGRPQVWNYVTGYKSVLDTLLALLALLWRHNDHDSVSNHQPRGYLLSRLFRRRSKKTSKLRVTGLCVGNSPGPVNSPHKGPVTRKMFPFDDVIMLATAYREYPAKRALSAMRKHGG